MTTFLRHEAPPGTSDELSEDASSPDTGQRRDPGLRWRRVFAIGVLGVALVVAFEDYLAHMVTGPGDHQVGDWLISYPGEFVRRGLFGEILFAVTPHGVTALWVLAACQVVLYALVVAYVVRFLQRQSWSWSAIALACSPAGIAFIGWDLEGGFRKEILGFAALVLLAFARQTDDRRRQFAMLVVSLLLWTIGIFSWESLAFMLPAVAYLLLASGGLRGGRWWAAAFAGVAAVGLSVSVAFRGDAATPSALCAKVTDHGLSDHLCTGAIAWMGRGTGESTAALTDAVPVHSAYLLLVPLTALPVLLSPWLRKNWRWALLITVSTLPLFALGVDYGRWLHVLFMQIAICMMIAPPALIRSTQWTGVASGLYVSLWGIPHAWPLHDAPGWPFRGLLATGIELLQRLMFEWR